MTWEGTDAQSAEGNIGLTAFSGGPAASACRARDKDARDKAYKDQLDAVYSGFKDNYVSHRFMDWPSDPWTLAGYSFPAPGQVTTCGPLLRQGMGHLHFAGEHTCYKFVGYMEGGLNPGASFARRLAARDGIIIEPPPAPKPAEKKGEKKDDKKGEKKEEKKEPVGRRPLKRLLLKSVLVAQASRL